MFRYLLCVVALVGVLALAADAKACDQFGVQSFGSCGVAVQSFGVQQFAVPVQTFAVNAFAVPVVQQNVIVRQRAFGARLFAPRSVSRTVVRTRGF